MIKQKTVMLLLTLISLTELSGCNNLSKKPLNSIVEPGIGYLDSKYRVCRENCPIRTKKVLDDSEVQLPVLTTAQVNQQITQPQPVPPAKENADIYIVQFEFGRSVPTQDGIKTLGILTKNAQNATLIELLGGTDNIGTRSYNNKLAHSRVSFVARWLKQHGVKSKISVEAKGECCHPTPYNKTETTLRKMRRVQAKVQPSVQPIKESEK